MKKLLHLILFLSSVCLGSNNYASAKDLPNLPVGCFSGNVRLRVDGTNYEDRVQIKMVISKTSSRKYEIQEESDLDFSINDGIQENTTTYSVKLDRVSKLFKGKQDLSSPSFSIFGTPRAYLRGGRKGGVRYKRTINWQYGDTPLEVEHGVGLLSPAPGQCSLLGE